MIKILFICHGNICRSPMAEFVMKKLVSDANLADHFQIASAATSTEEIWNGIGNPVYPPAKAELARHGISCEGKRARQVTKADYAEYDYLIGMDSANIRNMLRIFGGDPDGKVARLLSYVGSERDISDPWYTGEFGTNDYLIGMDSANIRNMLRIFGGDPDGKVARLLSYAGSERDISDPWYTGEFGTTYNDVLEGCTAFLQYLQQNGRIDT